MKKLIIASALVLCILMLGACGCEHEWTQPDCNSPAVCGKCGETGDEALGHNWEEADCVTPETCSRCFETRGNATGHMFTLHAVEKDFVNAVAIEGDVCTACGEVTKESRTNLKNFINGKVFSFTMSELAERLDSILNSQCKMSAPPYAIDSGGAKLYAIMDKYDEVIGYIKCYDNNAKPVNSVDNANIVFVSFYFYDLDIDEYAAAVAGAMALDPRLDTDSAVDVLAASLDDGATTNKNGIVYTSMKNETGGFTMLAGVPQG